MPARIAYDRILEIALPEKDKLSKDPRVKKAIDKIRAGGKLNIKKFRRGKSTCFRLKVDYKERFIFEYVKLKDGKLAIKPLAYIENHDYQKNQHTKKGARKPKPKKIAKVVSLLNLPSEQDDEELSPDELNQFKDDFKESTSSDLEAEVIYHRKQQLSLTSEQQKAIPKPTKSYDDYYRRTKVYQIQGPGGVGKTLAAEEFLLTKVFHESEEEAFDPSDEDKGEEKLAEKLVGYVTESATLAAEVAEDFAGQALCPSKKLQSYSFEHLLFSLGLLNGKTLVGPGDFKTFLENRKRLPLMNNWTRDFDRTYEDCLLCHGRTKEEYLALGKDESPLSRQERIFLYDEIYSAYMNRLGEHLIHPGFCPPCPAALRGRFKALVVDEAQDFSFSQYKFLTELADKGSILFCTDHNQNLTTSIFSHPHHLSHLFGKDYPEPEILKTSHRTTLQTTFFANSIANKNIAFTGGYNKGHGPRQIEAIGEHNPKGHIFRVTEAYVEELLQKDDLGPEFVIITHPNEVDVVRERFPKHKDQILTPEDIKGRGRRVVLWYKLVPDDFLKEALKKQKELDLSQEVQYKPKDGGDLRFSKEFNRMYVTATRAQDMLLICEPEDRFELFAEEVKYFTAGNPPENFIESNPLTDEEWIEQAKYAVLEKKPPLATSILQTKLKEPWDDAKCLAFIKELSEKQQEPNQFVVPPAANSTAGSANNRPPLNNTPPPRTPHIPQQNNRGRQKKTSSNPNVDKAFQLIDKVNLGVKKSMQRIDNEKKHIDQALAQTNEMFDGYLNRGGDPNLVKTMHNELLKEGMHPSLHTNAQMKRSSPLPKSNNPAKEKTPKEIALFWAPQIKNNFNKETLVKIVKKFSERPDVLKELLQADTLKDNDGNPLSLIAYIFADEARSDLFFQWLAEESILLLHLSELFDEVSKTDDQWKKHNDLQVIHTEFKYWFNKQNKKDFALEFFPLFYFTRALANNHKKLFSMFASFQSCGVNLNQVDDNNMGMNLLQFLALRSRSAHVLIPTLMDKYGLDPHNRDHWGRTVVHYAVSEKNLKLVSELIKRLTPEELNAEDNEGHTPVLVAIQNDSLDIVEDLLKAIGANEINKILKRGMSMVHLLANNPCPQRWIPLLAKYGADFNQPMSETASVYEFGPLAIIFIMNSDYKAFEALLKTSANIHISHQLPHKHLQNCLDSPDITETSKERLTQFLQTHQGTHSTLSPREIAYITGQDYFVQLIDNHPSSKPKPSPQIKEMIRQMKQRHALGSEEKLDAGKPDPAEENNDSALTPQ
jgi:hypothetical protein